MRYTIGIDFGTLSARALLVDTVCGSKVAEAEFPYPHAVMKSEDFSGVTLKKTDAFQHPRDYLDALSHVVKKVLEGIDPVQVAGLGMDFTACTVLPVTQDGTPLCFLPEFQNEPQAYTKLWKHHSAQKEADEITALARKEDRPFLRQNGGSISAEGLFPKLLETFRKAPEVYRACRRFLEAGDWLTWLLTGNEVRSSNIAGYKALWDGGYPENEFWERVQSGFGDIIGTKISGSIAAPGAKAGTLNAYGSRLTGLPEGTAVAVPIIDAHAALPAAGIAEAGKLMLIVGTSTCQILMSQKRPEISGIIGHITSRMFPGLETYESGQAATGDSFDWFVENCVPESYTQQAKAEKKDLFRFLTEKAESLRAGDSGLVALDWWNGNRCPYSDGDLTGVMVGMSLRTKPEEIFRALMESTVFGTKTILDLYEKNGIEIKEVYAAGGIAKKNRLLMQMYADILGKEIRICGCAQAGALGSAILAAAASGAYPCVSDAAKAMADPCETVYSPDEGHGASYQKLYRAYRELSDYFAKSWILKNSR